MEYGGAVVDIIHSRGTSARCPPTPSWTQ